MDINERKQFADILYKTVIPSGLSALEYNEKYSLMTNYISRFFPQTLYRFLRCDEKRIDAFYKNQIWVANLEKMNDGYDGRLFFNRSEVENDLQNSLSDEALQRFILNNQSNDISLLLNQNWKITTGIGVCLGHSHIRAIDVDGMRPNAGINNDISYNNKIP